ncbi:MAG: UDP-forming cellulose synthase catalytic subunit [Rubellimicrobium sp.]|nr:UDP-forming cellulose synthase catalytic subunit [Rubellimicrobium sp.]
MAKAARSTGRFPPEAALWLVTAIPILAMVSVPTSTSGQAFLSIVAVVIVALLKPFSQSLIARFFLLATASLVVMRYYIWRVLETLPQPGLTVSFVVAVILLLVESYSIFIFFLNAFISADPTRRPFPPQVAPLDLPSVDILVPSYNEPPEMLKVTLSAARSIIYPRDKLRVVLCDDGGTDQRCNSSDPDLAARSRERRETLQKLCADLGVEYSTRAQNLHAKAGNMSAALESLDGELVVVFDADHVPSRDFLARTVGYFRDDPKLFLVQTPHFFINNDPIQRNLQLTDRCPPENEMFYGQIHRGLDRWGGAFFCGSAAVLRRSALDSVGGFAGETITEDAETALEIHSAGWKSLYLDRAMIAGLQPETFASFIQQRGRWATGMMQMLVLKNPLFRRGLRLPQRLCYLNSMSFWLFPLIRLVYILIPLVYLYFGVEIFVATIEDVLAFMLGYLAVSFLVQSALFSRYRWPLISEIYEVAQAPYLARAVILTFLRPRAAKFNVTAKDETLDEDYISPVHWPLTGLWLLTLTGIVAFAIRWSSFPGDRGVLAVVGGWAVFNFVLTSIAWRAVAERRQRRVSPRVQTNAPATVRGLDEAGDGVDARVRDVSTAGIRIHVPATAQVGGLRGEALVGSTMIVRPRFVDSTHLEADIMVRVMTAKVVPDGVELGTLVVSEQPIAAQGALAFLMFGDSDAWHDIRMATRSPKSLVLGLVYIVVLFLTGLPRVLWSMLRSGLPVDEAEAGPKSREKSAHLLAFGVDVDEQNRQLESLRAAGARPAEAQA